jgi:hypothetical protein
MKQNKPPWLLNLKKAFFFIILQNVVLIAAIIETLGISAYLLFSSFSLQAVLNARYSLIAVVSLVIVYLIFSLLSFVYIYRAMRVSKDRPAALISGEIGIFLLIVVSFFSFFLFLNPLITIFSIFLAYLGFALIGAAIFQLGSLYKNSNLEVAGILFMIPILPITQFIAAIIGYFSI